jgi:hypothetical protein
MPQVRCLPSPCGRLSRPRTTTKAPPHPGANSRQRACPHRAGSPRMVPTFIADRSTGAAPSFAPAASPRVRRRPSSWPPRQPRNTSHGVALPTGTACTASRPTSARLEPMPRLRGFDHWFALAAPSRLACRTQAVWRYRPVPSLSGLLPPAPCASKARLPPASTTRCDGPPLDLSSHSINRRLVAHFALAAHPGESQGRPSTNAGSKPIERSTACPTCVCSRMPHPGRSHRTHRPRRRRRPRRSLGTGSICAVSYQHQPARTVARRGQTPHQR